MSSNPYPDNYDRDQEHAAFWGEFLRYALQRPRHQKLFVRKHHHHSYIITIDSTKQIDLRLRVNPTRTNDGPFVAVGLHLHGPLAKANFQRLKQSREAIEKSIGYPLHWEDKNRTGRRIMLYHQGLYTDPNERQLLIVWLYNHAVVFYEVLPPFIDLVL